MFVTDKWCFQVTVSQNISCGILSLFTTNDMHGCIKLIFNRNCTTSYNSYTHTCNKQTKTKAKAGTLNLIDLKTLKPSR